MVSAMKTKHKIISPALKTKIMSEAEVPGCIISEVAARHKIPKQLLYSWRSKSRRSINKKIQRQVGTSNDNPQPNFVELTVSQLESPTKAVKRQRLKRLSLEFEGFSLAIDGNLSSKKLIKLITVLEEAC